MESTICSQVLILNWCERRIKAHGNCAFQVSVKVVDRLSKINFEQINATTKCTHKLRPFFASQFDPNLYAVTFPPPHPQMIHLSLQLSLKDDAMMVAAILWQRSDASFDTRNCSMFQLETCQMLIFHIIRLYVLKVTHWWRLVKGVVIYAIACIVFKKTRHKTHTNLRAWHISRAKQTRKELCRHV